jgi:hypothetical protein
MEVFPEMARDARPSTGWIRIIQHPIRPRYVLSTTGSPADEAFGWFHSIAEVNKIGTAFLRSRGHANSTHNFFSLLHSFIRHAKTFYRSAKSLEHRSSPLIYDHAFPNLAKAYILPKNHQFTGRRSNHGIGFSLRPSALSKQFVTTGKAGVFINFYRHLTGVQLHDTPTLNVPTLLGYCSDIWVEYEISKFGERRMARGHIALLSNGNTGEWWILTSIQNFASLNGYKKFLGIFHRLMEEVNISSFGARERFGIMGNHKSHYRFFENRSVYRKTEGQRSVSRKDDIGIG